MLIIVDRKVSTTAVGPWSGPAKSPLGHQLSTRNWRESLPANQPACNNSQTSRAHSLIRQ